MAQLAPPRAHLATLSRSGYYLAYTLTEGDQTRIDVVAVNPPYPKQSIYLGDTRGARIVALAWTAPDRLVLATEDWAIATATLGRDVVEVVLDASRFETMVAGDLNERDRENPLNLDRMPRPPRLLHVDWQVPNQIIVEGVAGTNLRNAVASTARVDLVSGQWTIVDEVRITAPATRVFADRLGYYRLQVDRTQLPLTWSLRDPPGQGHRPGWKLLRHALPEDLAHSFNADTAHLWNDRSVPLGFGADPSVLFYSSNLARDTFALRSINLTTGESGDFDVEVARVDLAAPVTDIAPRPLGRHERAQRRNNPAVYYTDFNAVPPVDPLIYDRATGDLVGARLPHSTIDTYWTDSFFQTLQSQLQNDFPHRSVQVIDWDDDRTRFLLNVSTTADDGRYIVYHREEARWVEFLRRNSDIPADQSHRVETTAISDEVEPLLPVRLTIPHTPRSKHPPLICYFRDGPWQLAPDARFAPAHLLAELGCRVLEIDYRSSAGRGRDLLNGGRISPDEAAAADLQRALDWLRDSQGYAPRQIALVGEGFGGWLALRVAELQPDRFRCVASLDGFNDLAHLFRSPPPRERIESDSRGLELARDMFAMHDAMKADFDRTVELATGGSATDQNAPAAQLAERGFGADADPFAAADNRPQRLQIAQRMRDHDEPTPVSLRTRFAQWYFGEAAENNPAYDVLAHLDDLRAPVLLCVSPDREDHTIAAAAKLRDRLARLNRPVEYWELPSAPWSRPISERPEVWLRVAEFLNENLLDFDVQIGPTREVP